MWYCVRVNQNLKMNTQWKIKYTAKRVSKEWIPEHSMRRYLWTITNNTGIKTNQVIYGIHTSNKWIVDSSQCAQLLTSFDKKKTSYICINLIIKHLAACFTPTLSAHAFIHSFRTEWTIDKFKITFY